MTRHRESHIPVAATIDPRRRSKGLLSRWWRKWRGLRAGGGAEFDGAVAALVEVLETIPAGIAVFDKDDRLQLFNSRYRDVKPEVADIIRPGVAFETLVRTSYERGVRYVVEEGEENARENMTADEFVARAVALHRALPLTMEMKVADDGWIELKKERTPDGRTVAVYSDITAKKQREAELRQQGERLAHVIHASHDGFWNHNLSTNEAWYSVRFNELLGYGEGELAPTFDTFIDHLHPDDRDRVRHAVDTHLESRHPYDIEYRLRTKQGGYRLFQSRGLAWRDADGRPLEMSGSIRDITERHETTHNLQELSRNLKRARDEAEGANQAKSDFLATMSHEVRTPLNGILGMVTLLISTNMTLEQRRYAESLRSAGNVLLTLVNDILDFSKLEAGKLELAITEFDLAGLVDGVVEVLLPEARHKEVALIARVAPEFSRTVTGDPDRVRQVLMNLVGNAVKFTQQGSVTIEVTSEPGEGRLAIVQFKVIDTGIGIPDEDRATIFERFTQADSTSKRNFGGTGLGLAICRQLVEAMDGEIGIESADGEGSTFRFAIPLVMGGDRAPVAPTAAKPVEHHITDRLRILLAEDNGVNQMYIATLLRKVGHEVEIAVDGVAAVELLKSAGPRDFDVVLMDVHMPRMDGIEATRVIRALNDVRAEIPIVALTANAMKGDRETYLAAGMNGYVSKPIDVEELARVLARVTGREVRSTDPLEMVEKEPNGAVSDEAGAALTGLLERLDTLGADRA